MSFTRATVGSKRFATARSIGCCARAMSLFTATTSGSASAPSTVWSPVAASATVAGAFGASAASLAIVQENGDLLYCAAWGAVSEGVIGMRLTQGTGLAGAVAATGEPLAVPDCRNDPRFAGQVAANTGYVPHTMLVLPLERDGRTIGVLSILDRRDGRPYTPADLPRAEMFAGLAQAILA
jgi:signal transduction protein with GAF and PtsI domain